MTGNDSDRDILLDVSRLIWRGWTRRHPTGIDRVCRAYLQHFKDRGRAVVQRRGLRIALSAKESGRLFQLLLQGREASRFDWLRLGLSLLPAALRGEPVTNAVYLNVGHTGLDEPSLPDWVRENNLRAVYLVHDLIPLTHPQFCRVGEKEKHARRVDHLLASASGVIVNSQATLRELEGFADTQGRTLPPTLIALIAGDQARPDQLPCQLGRTYFVVVGTIEARKNHLLLLEVWRQLVREMGAAAPILVIAGQRGWEAGPVLAILDDLAELQGHVIEISNCDDEELASWIAGARALLMPSFVEGFGLPIVEALQISTPVIASDLPVYRELASDIPTYLDPDDQGAWLSVIKEFVRDGSERARQEAKMAGYQAPTWPEHFKLVESWLTRID